jgi:hypothetical protein
MVKSFREFGRGVDHRIARTTENAPARFKQ